MKKTMKLSLVFIFFLGLVNFSQAQVRLDIGLKAGPNFASLNTSSSVADNYKGRTGFHGGAYVMLKVTKFAIQPEVIFSKQGQNFKVNSQNYSSNYDYINIPVMIKFYLAAGLNLQAGPQFGFLASSKGVVINAATGGVQTGQDMKNFVKSSDVSLGVGLGWDLPLGLNVTARYNIGLSNINKLAGSPVPAQYSSSGTQDAKNQVFQFSVGYRLFKIGS